MEQQNKKPITLGSLFDGSGGFPLGGCLQVSNIIRVYHRNSLLLCAFRVIYVHTQKS